MLDIKYIHENQEVIKKAIKNKRIDLDLDKLLEIDEKRVKLLQKIEDLNAQKNKLNEEIKNRKNKDKIIAEGKKVKEKIGKIEPEYKEIKRQCEELMVRGPNPVSPDTPVGKDENDNVEIEKWGKTPKFDFEPKDYFQLAKDLDIVDTERGTKVAGYRGYYLKNEGAMLAIALMMFALEKMVAKGYKPMIPPTLVKEFALFGSG